LGKDWHFTLQKGNYVLEWFGLDSFKLYTKISLKLVSLTVFCEFFFEIRMLNHLAFSKHIRLSFFLITFLLFIPVLTSASTIVRTGGSIGVAQDQVVEGDFYAIGESVSVSGDITEDILAAGARVIVNGNIGGDAHIVGATIDVNGKVSDDLRIIGTAVSISGEVTGNVVVIAESLKILSTAKIGGDVLFYGGRAEIAGSVGRDVMGRSERIRLDGPVLGSVDVRSTQVTLGDRANISGNLRYESTNDVTRSPNAVVAGSITKSDALGSSEGGGLTSFLIVFFISLFAGLISYLILPSLLRRVSSQVTDHPLRSALVGFGSVIILPIASLALFLSTLGIVVGGVVLTLFISLIIGAYAIVGVVTGVLLAKVLNRPDEMSIIWIVVGTLFIHMTMSVPLIGSAFAIGLVVIVFGALVEVVVRQIRSA